MNVSDSLWSQFWIRFSIRIFTILLLDSKKTSLMYSEENNSKLAMPKVSS